MCAEPSNVVSNASCASWAAMGECDANPDFMELSCAASCGVRCLWTSETVRVLASGRRRRMQEMLDASTPDKPSPGGALCREDAALCIPGERCPCDLRPTKEDLAGPRGLRRVDAQGGHTSEVDHLLRAMLRDRPPSNTVRPRLLFIGMGTGKMVTMLKLEAPHVLTDVIEYDANMVKAAQAGFDFSMAEGEQLFVADAEEGVREAQGPYDAVVIDCMVSGIIPPSCRSETFLSRAAGLLAPGGVYAQFVWSDQRDGLRQALLRSHAFAHTHLVAHVPLPTALATPALMHGASRDTATLNRNAHPDQTECERWAASGECDTNVEFMQSACAAACYLALATSDASSPLLATHNGWLVATDSDDTFRLVCTESLTTCTEPDVLES